MKQLLTQRLASLATTGLLLGFTCTTSAEDTDPSTPKKRPHHEDIAKKQQEQAKQKKTFKPLTKKEAQPAKKRSLIANSTILRSGEQWTLIPKGSVLHIPPHLKNKITAKPTGTLVDWKTFLRKNHGWLHIHQVTMTQAQGKKTIQAEVIKAYQSTGKIVVATCPGGPISVAPASLQPKPTK